MHSCEQMNTFGICAHLTWQQLSLEKNSGSHITTYREKKNGGERERENLRFLGKCGKRVFFFLSRNFHL